MTTPRTAEAAGSGPAVEQAAGPFCPLPYDCAQLITDVSMRAGLAVTLAVGARASMPFTTPERAGLGTMIQNNEIIFTCTEEVVLTEDDIHAALRGDVDSVEYSTYATRTMAVALPRPPDLADRRATATRVWAEHVATLADQRAAVAERHAREAIEQAERDKVRQEAAEKARELLFRLLDDKQRKTAKKKNYFDITGSGGTRYRINLHSASGNVWWMRSKPDKRFTDGIRWEPVGNFCGHCGHDGTGSWLPKHDHHLAQALELRYDEIGWLDIAVYYGGEMPPAWWLAQTPAAVEGYAYHWNKDPAWVFRKMCRCGECGNGGADW